MYRHPGIRYFRRLIQREGIWYAVRPLPPGLGGAYYEQWGQSPRILVTPDVRRGSSAQLVSVLAEELGHYYRNLPAYWPPGTPDYTRRLHARIQERRALRWAAERLVTRHMRTQAARLGVETLEELATLWRVSRKVAGEAIQP